MLATRSSNTSKLSGSSRRTTSCAVLRVLQGSQSHRPVQACRRRAVAVQAMMSSPSTNPAFTMGKVQDALYETGRGGRGEIMTVEGTLQKTGLMLAIATVGAAYTWVQIFSGTMASAYAAMATSKVAGMVGFAAAIATMFKPNWAPVTGLIYSLAKGLAVGGMAAIMELRYPGIVLNTTMLTLGTAFSLYGAFQARIINVNDNFRSAVTMVTGGFMLTMLGTWVLSMFGVQVGSLFSAGPMGIGIGLVSAGLAASNLLIDFDMIRSTARSRMPKWFEYYSAFSLMITLVWMWTSLLRLLGMLSGGRDE